MLITFFSFVMGIYGNLVLGPSVEQWRTFGGPPPHPSPWPPMTSAAVQPLEQPAAARGGQPRSERR